MAEPRSLLILGARRGSIGDLVEQEALASKRWSTITTAGVSGDEGVSCDLASLGDGVILLNRRGYTDVVCTVGVNTPHSIDMDDGHWLQVLEREMKANAIGPLSFLKRWIHWWTTSGLHQDFPIGGVNFLAISSNSAHIARSQSTAYCASKAALSMGLRTMARAVAGLPRPINILGYEFGWVNGTPMSAEVDKRMHDSTLPLHRIPGGRALSKDYVAKLLVADLIDGGAYFKNGCTIRIDGGEQ